MFWVVVKEREHGSLVYVSGGGVNHRLFRVRSGRNLNLSFSLYGLCDLGQANLPSESQFPICKRRTLIHFARCWEFQSQTGKPSAPSKYLVNICSLHCCQVSCVQGWRGEGKYENIIIEKNDEAIMGSFTYFTECGEKNKTGVGIHFS